MSESKEIIAEAEEAVKNEDQPTEEKTTTPESVLQDLQNQRTGMFDLDLSYSEANYFRNMLDKAEYKGPQQAYLLIISKLEISQICESLKGNPKEEKSKVQMSSASIESISYFMNNRIGTGANSAQKLFAASMVIRPAVSKINELDHQISIIQKGLEQESN